MCKHLQLILFLQVADLTRERHGSQATIIFSTTRGRLGRLVRCGRLSKLAENLITSLTLLLCGLCCTRLQCRAGTYGPSCEKVSFGNYSARLFGTLALSTMLPFSTLKPQQQLLQRHMLHVRDV